MWSSNNTLPLFFVENLSVWISSIRSSYIFSIGNRFEFDRVRDRNLQGSMENKERIQRRIFWRFGILKKDIARLSVDSVNLLMNNSAVCCICSSNNGFSGELCLLISSGPEQISLFCQYVSHEYWRANIWPTVFQLVQPFPLSILVIKYRLIKAVKAPCLLINRIKLKHWFHTIINEHTLGDNKIYSFRLIRKVHTEIDRWPVLNRGLKINETFTPNCKLQILIESTRIVQNLIRLTAKKNKNSLSLKKKLNIALDRCESLVKFEAVRVAEGFV